MTDNAGIDIEQDSKRWEVFGKPEDGSVEDPQRHVNTSYVSRVGASGVVVLSEKAGDINSRREGETGFYVGDMRVVSELGYTVNGARPVVRTSRRDDTSTHFRFDFKNPVSGIRNSVDYTFDEDTIYSRVRFKNTSSKPVTLRLAFRYAADHEDTFNVRFPPPQHPRGPLSEPCPEKNGQSIRYERLDGGEMVSYFRASEEPEHEADGTMIFSRTLNPKDDWEIVVSTGMKDQIPDKETWGAARRALVKTRNEVFTRAPVVRSGNPRLAAWIKQSQNDLALLTAKCETGLYGYAGLPWFTRPFGRDGVIVALQTVTFNPKIAEGSSRHHAAHMATTVDTFTGAQPGKRMHESRLGDVCGAGLLPFAQNYMGVDQTMLDLLVAKASYDVTGNVDLLAELWPALDMAGTWMSEYGDMKQDGFIRYVADKGMGLASQGWKDSWPAIVDEKGNILEGEIALCEVQGYAYAAWNALAFIAETLGHHERAAFCKEAAQNLYERFNDVFWNEEKGIYAIALDGNDAPSWVKASNMAHLGMTGIVPQERAQRVLRALMSEPLHSGWGLRTLASDEVAYGENIYHNGPVWPHENSFLAWFCVFFNDRDTLKRIMPPLLDAAEAFEYRLPELISGHSRVAGEGPMRYPSANSPHNWAAAVAFSLLSTAMKIDARKSELVINPSGFPDDWLPLEYSSIPVGKSKVSFRLNEDNSIDLLNVKGPPVRVIDGRNGLEIPRLHVQKKRSAELRL
jgi:glycogen debranching enzyme